MKFGRWRVLALDSKRMRYGRRRQAVTALWHCVCDCGSKHLVVGANLRHGHSTSCGCLKREKLIKRNTKHGHACRGKHTSIYDRWVSMKQRCFNPNNRSYANYGDRGITVCEYYRSFENLFADILDPPPGLSIDRIDNDGGYEPGNLQWATASMQVNNRRRPKKKR